MISIAGSHWPGIISKVANRLLDYGKEVNTGSWHAMDIKDDPKYTMIELLHVELQGPIHTDLISLREVSPNLPWADDHFKERVSGIPYNPPPSHEYWPFVQSSNETHIDKGKFSHTYPERFFPKYAGNEFRGETVEYNPGIYARGVNPPLRGIRFDYGDLDDVINLLMKDPTTRQAYLPIFFPEDTGAVMGQRVPCSIGYHFIIRDGFLDVTYHMRSCDFIRNFRDDVYMAARLGQYVIQRINDEIDGGADGDYIMPRALIMNITSLHLFKSEKTLLENLCK